MLLHRIQDADRHNLTRFTHEPSCQASVEGKEGGVKLTLSPEESVGDSSFLESAPPNNNHSLDVLRVPLRHYRLSISRRLWAEPTASVTC